MLKRPASVFPTTRAVPERVTAGSRCFAVTWAANAWFPARSIMPTDSIAALAIGSISPVCRNTRPLAGAPSEVAIKACEPEKPEPAGRRLCRGGRKQQVLLIIQGHIAKIAAVKTAVREPNRQIRITAIRRGTSQPIRRAGTDRLPANYQNRDCLRALGGRNRCHILTEGIARARPIWPTVMRLFATSKPRPSMATSHTRSTTGGVESEIDHHREDARPPRAGFSCSVNENVTDSAGR